MAHDPPGDVLASAFALADRPVWVVTAAHAGRRGGLTATWVMQASIDPAAPALAVGIAPLHFTAELIDASGALAAHLLGADQAALALRLALASGRDGDKLAGVAVAAGHSGSPILRDCLAWFDCRVAARFDAGDRLLYWCQCIDGGLGANGPPLVESRLLAAASSDERRRLKEAMHTDVAALRPLRDRWLADRQGR